MRQKAGNKQPAQRGRVGENDRRSKLVNMDIFYTVNPLNPNKMDTFDPPFVLSFMIALAEAFYGIDKNTYFMHKLCHGWILMVDIGMRIA